MTETGQDDRANKNYYDDFSSWYERERGEGYHAMIDELEIDVIAPLAKGQVLEMGCGTGLILEKMARYADRAVGIDLSEGMIRVAQERGLDVQLGSVTDLPFEDDTFDLVYSFKVLAHIPDIGKALAEAARVTKPGGHLALEFYNPLSLRYLAKKIAGPQKISETRTEADVYTRWDTPWTINKLLPPGVTVKQTYGVRCLTPAAFVHRLPFVKNVLPTLEKVALDSPLRWVGGFLVVVLQKQA